MHWFTCPFKNEAYRRGQGDFTFSHVTFIKEIPTLVSTSSYYIDPLHNAGAHTHMSPVRHFRGQSVHVFLHQCSCKHVYHTFVHVLNPPKMAERRRDVQFAYMQNNTLLLSNNDLPIIICFCPSPNIWVQIAPQF